MDLLKENDLRKLADGCLSSHKKFEVKVSQLKANFLELKKRVEGLFNAMCSGGCKDVEKLIKEHQGVIGDQKIIMQALRLDFAFVCLIMLLLSESHRELFISTLRDLA